MTTPNMNSEAIRTMSKAITIDAEPVEPITVRLVGKPYVLTPPKGSLGLKLARRAKELGDADGMAMWGEIEGWLAAAVGPKQAKAISKRLDDPEDLLDVKHVISLMQQVMKQVTQGDPSS